MQTLAWLIYLLGAIPLWRAWQSNRQTSLFQALTWTIAAWAAWGGMMALTLNVGPGNASPVTAYLALCLTGCAGVAVLGARRPGVGAWNFVVFGLLAVMLLPLAENPFGPGLELGWMRVVFLAAVLAVGIVNYLPTRLAPAAFLLGLACVNYLVALVDDWQASQTLTWWLLALTPWMAIIRWYAKDGADSDFDKVWLNFRDRFGFLWGQRMREQFNRSAANSGWPVVLRWQGLRLLPGAVLPEPAIQDAIVTTLRSLLHRFGQDEGPEEDEVEESKIDM